MGVSKVSKALGFMKARYVASLKYLPSEARNVMQGGHLYCVAPVLSTDLVFLCYRSNATLSQRHRESSITAPFARQSQSGLQRILLGDRDRLLCSARLGQGGIYVQLGLIASMTCDWQEVSGAWDLRTDEV